MSNRRARLLQSIGWLEVGIAATALGLGVGLGRWSKSAAASDGPPQRAQADTRSRLGSAGSEERAGSAKAVADLDAGMNAKTIPPVYASEPVTKEPPTRTESSDTAKGSEGGLVGCVQGALRESDAVLGWVERTHELARLECLRQTGNLSERPTTPTDPREPCGALSERLRSVASERLRPVLDSVSAMADEPLDERPLFADVPCTELSDSEYAAALHMTSLAADWVDTGFLQCALQRESTRESFTLWSLLDAAKTNPDSAAFLDEQEFTDERTLRRLRRLRNPKPQHGRHGQ